MSTKKFLFSGIIAAGKKEKAKEQKMYALIKLEISSNGLNPSIQNEQQYQGRLI